MDESRVTAACSTRRRPQRLDDEFGSWTRLRWHRPQDVPGLGDPAVIASKMVVVADIHGFSLPARLMTPHHSKCVITPPPPPRRPRGQRPPGVRRGSPCCVLRLALGTRLLIRERCGRGRDPEEHRQRADSSLHCRGGWPRRADASGDAPSTGLPWRPKQLERMRLRNPCPATCKCATATPDARWISGRIRPSR